VKILDTDTCIALLRGNTRVVEHRRKTPESVVTTWITAGELFYGAAKSREPSHNRQLVEHFLQTLSILEFDLIGAQFFGAFKATLERYGRRLADADVWIGSIARAHAATLVTGNTRHFHRIPGLQLENWME
jgi:tRNA(fMet)-specific endonuclease VapC